MTDQENDSELLLLVAEQIETLKGGFIESLGPVTSTTKNILIQLFKVWRQVSLRRAVDLAESAHQQFYEGRLVPGCTLTRSLFETIAVRYYIHKKVKLLTEQNDPESVHNLLGEAVFGNKDLPGIPAKPIQVMTALDHIDKEFKVFRREYDHLCEYAHPNMKGAFATYAHQVVPSMETRFGTNPQGLTMGTWGLGSLEMILLVAREIEDRLETLAPRFIAMAENLAPDFLQ
jgi:hypothetical protein